jgi:signal transduction histidine kinase
VRRDVEHWVADVRVAAVVFAALEVGVFTEHYPAGYERRAWALTAAFALGAVAFAVIVRRASSRWTLPVAVASVAFDTAIIAAYALLYAYEYGSPTRWALVFPVAESALRFGLVGGIVLPLALFPAFAFLEWWRADRYGPPGYGWDRATFPTGIVLLVGAIVGWLVGRLRAETRRVEARAAEAEALRDELGRRVDLLDAATRCARALSSSLDLDEAFNAFVRELRGLIRFDRMAIVLAEEGRARVIATAGERAHDVLPPGSTASLRRNLLADVLAHGQTIYRPDMTEPRYDEEVQLVRLGVHARVAAPLLVGARPVGLVTIGRRDPHSFSQSEIELVSLLGRLVASAVQNIRAYEAERRTVEELRRLSALRADFVSLVSHELRSPMAAVIGSARTLQRRWRELAPEQRESFLALIADETSRLAALIGDVLDTSRIDAGTFGYTFADVDVRSLVEETVAAATIGQDEVPVVSVLEDPLPRVRGDAERLRQVLTNLVDNAVKYSPHGEPVEVRACALDGRVMVDVADRGPGVPAADRRLIFEKFGRASGGGAKPGTGLGLYIARSIAEAHGGSLEVEAGPARGAVFTLSLPVG